MISKLLDVSYNSEFLLFVIRMLNTEIFDFRIVTFVVQRLIRIKYLEFFRENQLCLF